MKKKRSKIHVTYRKKEAAWFVVYVRLFDAEGEPMTKPADKCKDRREAVQVGRAAASSYMPSSLVIHNRNGFKEERTYPRSSDPRKTKG